MTIFFDTYYNSGIGETPVPYGGEDIGFMQALRDSYEAQRMSSNVDTMLRLMTDELDPLIGQINQNWVDGKVELPNGESLENPGHYFSNSPFDEDIYESKRTSLLGKMFSHLKEYPELYPDYAGYTEQTLTENIKNRALEFFQKSEEISERTSGTGAIGQFLGQAGAMATDKGIADVVMSLSWAQMFSGMGKQTLGQLVLKEGILGAGTEAYLQLDIQEWYKSLGLPYTYEDFLINVGIGGLVGGSLPIAAKGIGGAVTLTRDQIRRGLEAFRGKGIPQADADLSIRQLEDFDQLLSPEAPGGPLLLPGQTREGRTIDLEAGDWQRVDLGTDQWKSLSTAELRANPAVANVESRMNSVPMTVDQPGYGTVKYDLERPFVNPKDGSSVIGTESAVNLLYSISRTLAWGVDLPVNPNRYEKRAFIVLGPPASGKSAISEPIARKYGAAIIDSDEAKKMMPEFDGGIGANAVHEESKFLSDIVEAKAIDDGINVVIPRVGGKAESIEKLINKYKQNGYEIDLIGMDVSALNARNRAMERLIRTGRYVPLDYLESIGEKPMQVYDALKQKGVADGYTKIDNNVGLNEPKPVIEDTRNIFEDVELRLRGSGREGRTVHPNARRTSEDAAPPSNYEIIQDRINKTAKAKANLEKGNLPDDDLATTQRRPAPPETKIEEPDVNNFVEQVSRDTDFDNMADDELLSIDLVVEDQVVTQSVSGADIKKDLAQDQQMLDRLRGCIV
jgi:predicted kinase